MRGVGSDEFREHVLEMQSEPVEALAQHTIGELRLLQRVGPRVHERTDGLVARPVRDGHLELVGRRLSLDAEDAHAIGSVRLEMNRREVGDHVGRDVRVRIAHLVHELFRDGLHGYPPARVRVLGHHEGAVGLRLDDRISDVGEILDRPPLVETIPARTLRSTLNNVARNNSRRELVPVRRSPSELVAERRHGERGVRRPSRNHDVRALRERLDDRYAADVRVRRDHAVANDRQGFAGFHVLQRVTGGEQLVDARQEIVARHHADAQLAARASRACHLEHRGGACLGIHAAGVCDDLDAALGDAAQHRFHRAHEILRVPRRRITFLLLLQNGHRDFGEVIEHEIVHRPALGLAARRLEPVAPEPLGAGDAHDLLRGHSVAASMRAGRTNAPRCGPGFCSALRSTMPSAVRVSSGYTIASTKPRAAA